MVLPVLISAYAHERVKGKRLESSIPIDSNGIAGCEKKVSAERYQALLLGTTKLFRKLQRELAAKERTKAKQLLIYSRRQNKVPIVYQLTTDL